MQTTLKNKLSGRINKDELILFINQNPEQFDNAVKLAIGNDIKLSWRAAWIIKLSMKENDNRLKNHIKAIIESIKNKNDGQQRELLNILAKMSINEDIEGYLFDVCMTIWEDTRKIPSVRIIAFRIIYKIVKKYPQLINEIDMIAQNIYADDLSPGIKKSFFMMKRELNLVKG